MSYYLGLDYKSNREASKQLLKLIKDKLDAIFNQEVPIEIAKTVIVITSNSFKESKAVAKDKLVSTLKKEAKVDKLMAWLESDYLKEYKKLYGIIEEDKIDTKKDVIENDEKSNKKSASNIFSRVTLKQDTNIPIKDKSEMTETMKEITEKGLLKKRCTFFPNCKSENCKYVHPKEECKKFPHCAFGEQCLYLHPQVNCTYGIRCKRPNCAYLHPANMQNMYKMMMKMMPINNKNIFNKKIFKPKKNTIENNNTDDNNKEI